MKKTIWVTHFIADCLDCDWHNELHKNGQALAAIHAKKHKHTISYEIGLHGTYDGKEEKHA